MAHLLTRTSTIAIAVTFYLLIEWHSQCKGVCYSTPRRSLCVRPDAGRFWTIFPPTHCTHEYLASVCHRALASASVRLRPCFCSCVRASASVLLRVCLPICVSVRASACPSTRLCVRPCICRSDHAGRASAGPVQIYICDCPHDRQNWFRDIGFDGMNGNFSFPPVFSRIRCGYHSRMLLPTLDSREKLSSGTAALQTPMSISVRECTGDYTVKYTIKYMAALARISFLAVLFERFIHRDVFCRRHRSLQENVSLQKLQSWESSRI